MTAAEHFGAIAVHGALIFALLGQPSEAERWAAAAERASPGGSCPTGARWRARWPTCARSCAATAIDEMRRDAQLAWEGLSPASPYRVTMLYTEGVSYLLQGDHDRADPILARAVDDATRAGALPLAALILAEQCQRGRRARRLGRDHGARRARGGASWRTGGSTTTGPAPWSMRGRPGPRCTQGNIAQARHYLGRAARLRPLLSYALPVVSVQALIEMARAYISLADQAGAATVLQQADDILQQRPDLGVLPAQVSELRSQLARIGDGAVGASALTAAELRLLPLLPTHLSFQEIGERLYVSTNTVKSQAYSAYRKLGVSSRSAAVTRARELGLDVP